MFILTKVVHRDQFFIHEMFPVPSPNSCTDRLESPFPTKETNMLEGNNNKTSMCYRILNRVNQKGRKERRAKRVYKTYLALSPNQLQTDLAVEETVSTAGPACSLKNLVTCIVVRGCVYPLSNRWCYLSRHQHRVHRHKQHQRQHQSHLLPHLIPKPQKVSSFLLKNKRLVS